MAGRPTDYDPEYHVPKLLELMSRGMLDCDIMSEFDISSSTFYRWKRDHQEFREAHERGLPKVEKAAIIDPLREMIATKNDKGYKPLAHIARNKFGHDSQQGGNRVNNTQINITISNIDDYKKLEQQVREDIVDLNFVDVDFLEHKKDAGSDPV